ncbi:hypothetical protein C8A00DRAFT_16913 [Chaetomidium leptoderma]|uniref:2EXR domain-containing protein n=1 Tax=Chaetomidium leptoderma TaxID=669021 RepID=A0AAN6VHP2_9PEZI|nr:hypothetical protein C8A00DRAFT_16913 [Chaetomidium leptoderma]
MSDSEESDHLGYLVEQSDNNESESDGLDHDESGSGSDSDAAEGPFESHGLFDLEAADSDGESGSSDSDDGLDSWPESQLFPQFMRLPFELRYQIWNFFCPDLTTKSRVYWFLVQGYYRDKKNGMRVVEGPFLEQQTRAARTMLAVHRESHELALQAFPDTLTFGVDARGCIRFNSEQDIVYVESLDVEIETMPQFPGFSEHIRHLGVHFRVLDKLKSRSSAVFDTFANLQTVHYLTTPSEHRPQHLRWCTSDPVKRYSIMTFEEQPGLGEDAQHLYCWPDVEHPAFTEAEIPLDGLAEDLAGYDIRIEGVSFNGVTIWPMIQFFLSDERLVEDLEPDLDDESSDEDGDEPNEYESEGIDDSRISDDSSGSDPDDRHLVVLDDDDGHQDEEGSEDGSSAFSESTPPGGYDGIIDLTGDDHDNIAGFSSPEQSSATLRGSDESAHESDPPAARASRLKRPRARVVESDSEDGSEDDLPRKRARTENRPNPIVLSSDDEEDEMRKMRTNRRGRAVISEDEDSEGEDEEKDGEANDNTDRARDKGTDWSGISSSGDEDDGNGDESDRGAAKPLTLAEKLQLHREQVPIPPSDNEDSDVEEMPGDDYDARDYADFQDDEEGNEISEDGDDDDQHGHAVEDEDDEGDYGY